LGLIALVTLGAIPGFWGGWLTAFGILTFWVLAIMLGAHTARRVLQTQTSKNHGKAKWEVS